MNTRWHIIDPDKLTELVNLVNSGLVHISLLDEHDINLGYLTFQHMIFTDLTTGSGYRVLINTMVEEGITS